VDIKAIIHPKAVTTPTIQRQMPEEDEVQTKRLPRQELDEDEVQMHEIPEEEDMLTE